jgi:hypothetical protein
MCCTHVLHKDTSHIQFLASGCAQHRNRLIKPTCDFSEQFKGSELLLSDQQMNQIWAPQPPYERLMCRTRELMYILRNRNVPNRDESTHERWAVIVTFRTVLRGLAPSVTMTKGLPPSTPSHHDAPPPVPPPCCGQEETWVIGASSTVTDEMLLALRPTRRTL